jgi:fructose-specific component phosphotransferase system IIB-like protein
LLDNIMSGLNGPNSFLSQTRTAAKLTTKDLQETEAHAADFMAPAKGSRFSGRNRRLLEHFLSGSSGPNSMLKQTRAIGKLTMGDLQETEAHAADFMAPAKDSRFSGLDRRLLDNIMSGFNGPNSFLSQTKTAAKLTTKDLQETEAHAADFMAPTKGSRFSEDDK